MTTLLAAKTLDDLLDQSLWVGIGLVVAVLVLAWVTYHLRAWFGEDEGHTDANQELLTHVRDLHREGEMSESEYRSIKGRLTGQKERPASTEADSQDAPAG
jgi:hypothetical protein